MKIPIEYRSDLGLIETERGIKLIKDTFERQLAEVLDLERVSAPKFLELGNGLQDDLAGTQEPVRFQAKGAANPVEMVHSLAKWKRMALGKYGLPPGKGLYTDMDAIRKDEEIDELHSYYVDQWDWEKVITREQRTLAFLEEIVKKIYAAILVTEKKVSDTFPVLSGKLPGEIKFIHTQELEDRYPNLSPRERESRAAEKTGAYFLVGIGGRLRSGEVHDLRAADYDDWTTENESGLCGLNGDIIVFDNIRKGALELSSMGIRVDKVSLRRQLEAMKQHERLELPFQQDILEDRVPLSIGGGIGQSRLCMLLLHKFHVGEVQVSVWPEEMVQECRTRGIQLL